MPKSPGIVYEVRGNFFDTPIENDQQKQKKAIIATICIDCPDLLNKDRFKMTDEDYDDGECRLVFERIQYTW